MVENQVSNHFLGAVIDRYWPFPLAQSSPRSPLVSNSLTSRGKCQMSARLDSDNKLVSMTIGGLCIRLENRRPPANIWR